MDKVIRAAKINGISHIPSGAFNKAEDTPVETVLSIEASRSDERNSPIISDLKESISEVLPESNNSSVQTNLEQELKSVRAEAIRWENLAQQADSKANEAEQKLYEYKEELTQLREKVELDGYEAGIQKAEAETQSKVNHNLQQLNQILKSLADAREVYLENQEEDVIEIVLTSLGKILGKELVTLKGVTAAVRKVLRQVSKRENLIVHVSPGDYKLLESHREQLFDGIASQAPDLVPDERVQIGGCIVEGQAGSLDGRLEVQLQILTETLLKVRKARTRRPLE